MKKLTALTLILALTLGLTGCFGGELKLYNAMEKMQGVTSIQSEMEMGFTFETEGFSEEDQVVLEQVAAVLNNAKIKTNMKQTQNEDQTVAKAEMDTKVQAAGMDMGMKIWVDVDLNGEEPRIVEIFNMPEVLMNSSLPSELTKEYLVYDIGEMMKSEGVEFDFNELIEFSKELQPELMEFLKGMYKDLKLDKDFITQKDDKVINNHKLEIFELKLNDANFKELVKHSVNHTLDNEATTKFIKEYMNVVMNMAVVPEAEKEEAEKEIQEGLANLETQLPEFKAMFNDFMDKYEDIEILGDKGIVIEYGIDEKGYLVHEAGNIDLKIDLGQITKALGEEPMEGIIKLGINYTSRNYNINNKVIMVRFPKLTKSNSMDYMEFLELQMKQFEEQMEQFEEIENMEVIEEPAA